MHYGLWSNNFNSLKEEKFKTIKVRSQFMKLAPRVEKAIGEINDMSKTDKEEVNVAYGCKGVFLYFLLITISCKTFLLVDVLQPL